MQLPKYFLFICMLFTYVCHSHASVFVKSDSLCTITKLHLDLPLLEKDHKLIQEIKDYDLLRPVANIRASYAKCATFG